MDVLDFIFSNREYFENFITRSTYHSNGIEGNTLSYAETYAIIFNDNSFKVTATARELYEATNHKYALNYVMKNCAGDLSESLIKNIGILINKNIHEINGYRKVPVFIKGAEYIPPVANMVPQMMMYYVYNYNHTEFGSIFEKIATEHLEFERVHPFEDGNGRTGRLLINYELLKNDLPPIVIPKENRTEYFKYLADENVNGLADFFDKLQKEEYKIMQQFGYDEWLKNKVDFELNPRH